MFQRFGLDPDGWQLRRNHDLQRDGGSPTRTQAGLLLKDCPRQRSGIGAPPPALAKEVQLLNELGPLLRPMKDLIDILVHGGTVQQLTEAQFREAENPRKDIAEVVRQAPGHICRILHPLLEPDLVQPASTSARAGLDLRQACQDATSQVESTAFTRRPGTCLGCLQPEQPARGFRGTVSGQQTASSIGYG